jgi:hypothetical protein
MNVILLAKKSSSEILHPALIPGKKAKPVFLREVIRTVIAP